MQIKIDWQKPLLLARHRKLIDVEVVFSKVAPKPGVYFFSRRFGKRYEPFYIGESGNLRTRLKQHLKSVHVVDALRGMDEEIPQGARYFHAGYGGGRGHDSERYRKIVQKFLIERALADDLPLLNIQLVKVKTHTLIFSGGRAARGIYSKRSAIKAIGN